MQWVVDHALLSADRDLVTLLALGFTLVALAQASISALRSWVVLNLSTRVSVQWSVNVFSHLLRLPQSYFEKRHLGDIVSRFDSISTIQKTLTTSVAEGILDGLMAIITLTMMIVYSGLLSIVTLIAVAVYAALRIAAFGPLRTATEEQIVLGAKQQSTFLESIRGIQAIKLFGKESLRLSIWHNRLIDTSNRLLRTQRFMIGYRFANGVSMAIENILVIWLGAQLILSHTFSIGMLFAFVAYKGVFSSRISSLVDKAIDVRMLRLQGERLADIVLSPKEDTDSNGVTGLLPDTSLTVQNVSFRYSDLDPFILRWLNLQIPAGASVAITGSSGCGKTTLAKLLLGLLRPTEGQIRVGHVEFGQLGLANYRSNVGSVMQDDQLFAGSVAENIAFFADKPDQPKIEHAARLAHVHDDIQRMTMGYHTLIGDMGASLSGGQKQRVLIARALYRNPQILVLDEATSHLDVDLEKAVNDSMRSLRITRIVIAHRPQTIAACDLVIELAQLNHPSAQHHLMAGGYPLDP